jgi:hypothetical protein
VGVKTFKELQPDASLTLKAEAAQKEALFYHRTFRPYALKERS